MHTVNSSLLVHVRTARNPAMLVRITQLIPRMRTPTLFAVFAASDIFPCNARRDPRKYQALLRILLNIQ